EGRAGAAIVPVGERAPEARRYWVAAERARSFLVLFPGAQFLQILIDVEAAGVSRDEALLTLVTGWMSHLGPTTAGQLGKVLALPASDIERALLRMEASGGVLRGTFTDEGTQPVAPARHETVELRS